MRCPIWTRTIGARRPGKILVLFSLMLPVMLGLVGLTVDGGLLMASHRQTQNAADAAALTAAMELFRGNDSITALAQANAILAQNGLADVTLSRTTTGVNRLTIPPQVGPHAGDDRFVEVIVERRTPTSFIHILGVNREQRVSARAVAGFEAVSSGEGAIVLDPRATSQQGGLKISGGAQLVVEGAVVVNSQGNGIDQYGVPVTSTYNQNAVSATGGSAIYANYLQVVGGVNSLNNIYHIEDYPGTTRTGPNPLYARANIAPDPLKDLPVPDVSNMGRVEDGSGNDVTNSTGNYNNIGSRRVFYPGVYRNISISNGANVTFMPGIYVLSPSGNNQGLSINGSPTVVGEGVMFYFTGSNYLSSGNPPGHFDRIDNTEMTSNGQIPSQNQGNVTYASLSITASGGLIQLGGYSDHVDPTDPSSFNNMLFYFRRRIGADDNRNYAEITGGGGPGSTLSGTIYAKWATFKLSGGGRYDAQFVVGGMDIAGQVPVTLLATGRNFGRANQVFLVE